MTFLPLVERELRARARMATTFRVRMGAACLAIAGAVLALLAGEVMFAPGDLGPFLFHTLGILSFIYCLFEGVRTTSDSLSEEKREGTLGLLFLTDLKGYDIVLGKLAASSLNSIYAFLAVIPALALPIVLGGITGGEFWRLALMLANTLFLSLSLGLFVSSISVEGRKAGAATLGLVCGLTLVPSMVSVLPGAAWFPGWSPSPLIAYQSLLAGPYALDPHPYWRSMAGIQITAWLFAVLASVLLPRNWRQLDGRVRGTRRLVPRKDSGPSKVWKSPDRSLLEVHPVMWLAKRGMGSSRPLWGLILGAGFLCLLMETFWKNPTGLFVNVLILHFILAIWAASDACHALAESRDSGALELLLATPLTEEEMIRGYTQGLQRRFAGPVLALILMESVYLVALASMQGFEEEDPLASLLIFGFVGVVLGISLLDIWATSRFGLWMGLVNKSPVRATFKTVLVVMLIPLGLSFFGLCCGFLWPVVGLGKNIVFIVMGRDRLRRDFRRVVTERYENQDGSSLVGMRPNPNSSSDLPSVTRRKES